MWTDLSMCGQGKLLSVQMVTGRRWGKKTTNVLGSGLNLYKSSCEIVSVPACASLSAHFNCAEQLCLIFFLWDRMENFKNDIQIWEGWQFLSCLFLDNAFLHKRRMRLLYVASCWCNYMPQASKIWGNWAWGRLVWVSTSTTKCLRDIAQGKLS